MRYQVSLVSRAVRQQQLQRFSLNKRFRYSNDIASHHGFEGACYCFNTRLSRATCCCGGVALLTNHRKIPMYLILPVFVLIVLLVTKIFGAEILCVSLSPGLDLKVLEREQYLSIEYRNIHVPNTEYCPINQVSNIEILGVEQYRYAQISCVSIKSSLKRDEIPGVSKYQQ